MTRIQTGSAAGCALLIVATLAQAQPAAGRSQVSGTVTGVNGTNPQLTIKSDEGAVVSVTMTERTVIRRIAPGETDSRKGTTIVLPDVAPGDRAVIVGPTPADPATRVATAVLVMSRGDVVSLQRMEQENWKKRGTTGIVTASDPAAGTVTIRGAQRTYIVRPSEKTATFRYAPDSPRFSDARPSSLADIRIGDQMRVLGNRSEDGSTIQAEKVVSGSFRQIAATITSVNPEVSELTIRELASKKTLTVKVGADSMMKRLPEQTARTLARRYAPGAPAAAPGNASADIGQMLDSLPAVTISELKPGAAIMLSTTQGSTSGRVTAIMCLTGVEPLLTASPGATRDILSGWILSAGDAGQ